MIQKNSREAVFLLCGVACGPAFRYAAFAVAQKQLAPEKSILMVDECEKRVGSCSLGDGIFFLFGIKEPIDSRDGESKGQLNGVIDHNKHTVLWIGNSQSCGIAPSSRRRSDYSIFFDELSPGSREGERRSCEVSQVNTFLSEMERFRGTFIERTGSKYSGQGGIASKIKKVLKKPVKKQELSCFLGIEKLFYQ